MKASELVLKIQEKIAQHGDLPVTVQDGLDPSDEVAAEELEYGASHFFINGHWQKHPRFHLR